MPGTNKQGVYDYFITDHLGNTRMILTEELQSAEGLCTAEDANAAIENPQFGAVNSSGVPDGTNELIRTRISTPSAWQNAGNNTPKCVGLINTTNKAIGPNVILKVMAGDVIKGEAKYFYEGTPAAPASNITNYLLTSLINSIYASTVSGPVKEGGLSPSNSVWASSGFSSFVSNQPNYGISSTPRAFLNVIFLDEQFNYAGAADPIRVGTTTSGNVILPSDIRSPKNGYAYIFLSNETENLMVYFDDFKVTHVRGRIVEENHYYPYGLKIAGISSRKLGDPENGQLQNRYAFQGDFAEEDEETGWNEFDLRMYDPQIGRWTQTDPYNEFANPYLGMANDPINYIDSDGGSPGGWGAFIGAVGFGVATNWAVNLYNDNNPQKQIGKATRYGLVALGAFLGAGVGYATFESISPGTEGFSDKTAWRNSSKNFGANFRAFYAGFFLDKTGVVSGGFRNQAASVNIWGDFLQTEWLPAKDKLDWVWKEIKSFPLSQIIVRTVWHEVHEYYYELDIPDNNNPNTRFKIEITPPVGNWSNFFRTYLNDDEIPGYEQELESGTIKIRIKITFDVKGAAILETQTLQDIALWIKSGGDPRMFQDNWKRTKDNMKRADGSRLKIKKGTIKKIKREYFKIGPLHLKFIKRKKKE